MNAVAAERLMQDQLHQLGMAMTKRRVELLKPHAGEIALSAAHRSPRVPPQVRYC